MIVWLNGPFGVGKTTVARELLDLVPDARLSDPERIGYVMRRTLWRGEDYQDVALWRRLTRAQVERAGRRSVAIVPMTVTSPTVFDEVTAGARVFLLMASRRTIESRITASLEGQAWRSSQLDRCLEAFAEGDFGETVDTDGLHPTAIARAIAARL
jgi:adenylylsulfate kinase-like enzyme